ncbi:MAG: heme exporter protein CcmB [Chloroflexota bacterium]|nr:heme exporter protein CcmB [Chloroflexota bacterium]
MSEAGSLKTTESRSTLTAWWVPILAILWKDVLLESRTRETVIPILVFSFLVIIVFNFVIDPKPALVEAVAPGILWVAFTFAGILGLNRSFSMEREQGGMEGLMMCPVGRDLVYLGKMLGTFLFVLLVELIMLPIFAVIFNLPLFEPGLWIITLMATFGFASVGATFSAIAVNTKAKEILLPILFFPIAAPVIIAAAEATRAVLAGDSIGDYSRWLQLMAVFDVMFVVIGSITFDFILGE